MRLWTLLHCAFAVAVPGCAASHGQDAVRTRDRHVSARAAARSPVVYDVAEILTSPTADRLSPEEQARLSTAAEQASHSVVHIRTYVRPGDNVEPATTAPSEASAGYGGSGFFFAQPGIILTTEHVLRDAVSIIVILPDGTEMAARQVAADERFDLALIAVNGVDLPTVPPASDEISAGAPVAALAGPNPRLSGLARNGRIVQTDLSLQEDLGPAGGHDYRRLVESTVPLESGFSGGPMIDGNGRLVGIVVAAAGSEQSGFARGYALPLDADVSATIDRLLAEVKQSP